jgi:L-ascorbate metabolism protein UlaG (beta-lactamase superfamily)
VVLSHLHGDHFDRVARRSLDKRVPLLTTPHAAERLGKHGFATQALRTWKAHTLERDAEQLTVESLPGIHARGVMGRLLPPVMGSMVTHSAPGRPTRRLYLGGDTLTGNHLDEISGRFPKIDAAVLHLGGTRVLLHTVTMDDRQGVDALRRVDAARALAVHHDDYGVFRSPVSAFVQRAARAGLGDRVRVPARGEQVTRFPEELS